MKGAKQSADSLPEPRYEAGEGACAAAACPSDMGRN